MSPGVMPSRSRIVSKVTSDPVTLLNHARASSAMSGSAPMKLLTWSTNRLPKIHTKTARPSPTRSMTTPVARPRLIRVASLLTAGSMARATNQAIST